MRQTRAFGWGAAAQGSLHKPTFHSNAGTEALGGKKSQQVLVSCTQKMSIKAPTKFQVV